MMEDGKAGLSETGPVARLNLRVRWAECDAAGIIYHARAFDWFSEGRIAWMEQLGLSYYQLLRPRSIELLVLECQARFVNMLQPGDQCELVVWAGEMTPTRVTFFYRVEREGRLMIEGLTRHVFVAGGHAINLRKKAPDLHEAWMGALAEQ
jgi:acyl-CoA thioester hydrolase